MRIIQFLCVCVLGCLMAFFGASVKESGAKPGNTGKPFNPAPYYLDISESGDCGNDLQLKKVENNLYDFELRTGCLDDWRGSYKGRAPLNDREMKINAGQGSMIFKFDSKGVNVTIKDCVFTTIEGSGGAYKIGQPNKIDSEKFYIPVDK